MHVYFYIECGSGKCLWRGFCCYLFQELMCMHRSLRKKHTSVHNVCFLAKHLSERKPRRVKNPVSIHLLAWNKTIKDAFTQIMYKPYSSVYCYEVFSEGSQVTLQIRINYASLHFCRTIRWSGELRFKLFSITQEIGILTFSISKANSPSLTRSSWKKNSGYAASHRQAQLSSSDFFPSTPSAVTSHPAPGSAFFHSHS